MVVWEHARIPSDEVLDSLPSRHGANWPSGDRCPECDRPHLFQRSDLLWVCDKCDGAFLKREEN